MFSFSRERLLEHVHKLTANEAARPRTTSSRDGKKHDNSGLAVVVKPSSASKTLRDGENLSPEIAEGQHESEPFSD